MSQVYFKTLRNGKSFHGGDFAYSLPFKDAETGEWAPGEWHEFDGVPRICSQGFHLTTDPKEWWGDNVTAYIAEFEGRVYGTENDKICVRKVRLTREATTQDLEAVQIFYSGHHEIRDTKAIGYGNSTIKGYGNSTIKGYDNSTIKGYDNSTIKGYGNSTIEGYGNSTIEGYDNSTIKGYGNSTIKGYGNSTIKGYGNSTIKGYGNSTIKGYDNSTIKGYGNSTIKGYGNSTIKGYDNSVATSTRWHGENAIVTTGSQSVHIDRRGSVIKIIVGGTSYQPILTTESEATNA